MDLRQLIRRMAIENPIWGEGRIANELQLKLGLRVSPRTVRKYMPKRPPGRSRGDQRWSTFLRNHAGAIVGCEFFVSVTATFRLLFGLVVIERCSRRLVRVVVTAHPSAAWTLQQLREVVRFERACEYPIQNLDSIFSKSLDESIRSIGLIVLKSSPNSSKANAICERVIGTIRSECLDWLIPLSESHLRSILRAWAVHQTGRVASRNFDTACLINDVTGGAAVESRFHICSLPSKCSLTPSDPAAAAS